MNKQLSTCLLALSLLPGLALAEPAASPYYTSGDQPAPANNYGQPDAQLPRQTLAPESAPVFGTPNPDTATVQGAVSATADLTQAQNYFVVEKTTVPVASLAAKQATGYQITFKSQVPVHVELLQAEVINAIDEQAVVAQESESRASRRRIGGGLLRGLSSVPFVGGFGYASVGAYQAAAIGSQVAGAAANVMDASAASGGAYTDGRFVRRVNNVLVNPNTSFSFNALVPKNQQPVVKVVFKNLQTNQIFDLQP